MSGFGLLLEVLGAVGLLLWAVRMVKTGIQRAWGTQLKQLLHGANHSRLTAAAIGLCLALVLQSATATSLLSLSLVSAGALSTASALSVFLGAEIGSTVVVQIFSHDLSSLTPVLLLVGVALFLGSEERKVRQLGRIAVGLGLLLLSLGMIVSTSTVLRDSTALPVIFHALANEAVLSFIFAALVTWLFHSTVASLLLIIALANSGVVDPTLGYLLVLGANTGGGLIVYALSRNEAPEIAVVPRANLLIRLMGSLVFLPWVDNIQQAFVAMGVRDVTTQLAWFYTLVGVTVSVVALPFIPRIISWLERLAPVSRDVVSASGLDPRTLLNRVEGGDVETTLNNATREILHLAERVEAMLACVPEMFEASCKQDVPDLEALENDVDERSRVLKECLVAIDPASLSEAGDRRCLALLAFCITLEQAADMTEQSLRLQAFKKIKRDLDFSHEGWSELQAMHKQLLCNMHLALHVIMSQDLHSAQRLLLAHGEFRLLENQNLATHLVRLRSGTKATRESSELHLDVMRVLTQINTLMTSVAQPMLQNASTKKEYSASASASASAAVSYSAS